MKMRLGPGILVKDEIVKGTRPFRDWPFRRINYIFVRFGAHGGTALDITACERIFDEPTNGTWANDHFGLVAVLVKPQSLVTPTESRSLA